MGQRGKLIYKVVPTQASVILWGALLSGRPLRLSQMESRKPVIVSSRQLPLDTGCSLRESITLADKVPCGWDSFQSETQPVFPAAGGWAPWPWYGVWIKHSSLYSTPIHPDPSVTVAYPWKSSTPVCPLSLDQTYFQHHSILRTNLSYPEY